MNNEIQESFKNYINEFKIQDIDLKRNEIINSLKELLSILDIISLNENIPINYLKSSEIFDIKYETATEDDFLEVYIENIKNIISEYILYKG